MKSLLHIIAVCLLFPVIGCQKGDVSNQKDAKSATSTQSTEVASKTITLSTSDGWKIVGDLFGAPNNKKGIIILLHQRGGSAYDWRNLCAQLQQEGFSALALDLRGTGRSMAMTGGKEAPWLVLKDIDAAIATLKGPIGLAGASYGANNALIHAANNHKLVKAVALFSPGLDYHGLEALPAAEKYKGAVAIWNETEDVISGEGPKQIAEAGKAAGYELHALGGSEHGTTLLNNEVILETVSFFRTHLK